MKHYHQLSSEERFYIHQALREGRSQQYIAKRLSRHPSTISRELKRNVQGNEQQYHYKWAFYHMLHRKQASHKKKFRKLTTYVKHLIIALIKETLSPEQVCAYAKEHHAVVISHETVYRFIYSNRERWLALRPYMRHGLKRRKRYGSGTRYTNIPDRTPLSERPSVVEDKTRLGDWECDTVVGGDRKSALVTLVDRTSLFTLSTRVPRKTTKAVCQAIITLLKPYKDKVKTLTFDNGNEFSHHMKIAKALNAKTYFAKPYSSWERGINENTNGLLRQFFPKGTNFNEVTDEQVQHAVHLLNNRPRKTRQYRSPNQVFNGIFIPVI
jgi:IS30 family transposase